MKKLLTVLTAAALSLALCSCGGKNNKPTDSSLHTESSVQASVEQSAVSAEESSKKQESSEAKKKASQPESSRQKSSQAVSEEQSEKFSGESSGKVSEEESNKVSEEESSEVSEEESSEASEEESSEVSEEESSEVSEEESDEVSEEASDESSEEQEESSREPRPRPDISGETVSADWFDDAVFVGDSVTLKLSYYADYGSLGSADFLCAGSLGYNNAQWSYDHEDNVHPVYNGVKYTVEDGVAMLQPNKIFIMLGMNDIGLYGVDGAVEGMKSLTAKIESRCPNAVIYVQSVTPMLENMQMTDLNNTTIAEFDRRIQPICEERGYIYLDVASAVDDGYGNLVYSYCGDPTAMGLHFSDAGCEAWVSYLKSHVA